MKTDNYFQKAADKLLEEGQEITIIDDLDKWEITGLDHDRSFLDSDILGA